MKMNYTHLIILVILAFMIMPVSADAGNSSNTTNTTVVATTNVTTVVTPAATTAAPAETNITTVATTAPTAVPTTTVTTAPTTTATTIVTTTQTTAITTGNLSVASSPLGAAILIDGVYYGTTPGNVTGISPGNHMLRLSLSGYTDYEGTVYVVAGQGIPAYGTLHPISSGSSQIILATASAPVTTSVPETTVQPTATQTSSSSALENPTVLAAMIGIITACIGAGATIFTHNAKVAEAKKEENKKE